MWWGDRELAVVRRHGVEKLCEAANVSAPCPGSRRAVAYDAPMKTWYLFAVILAASVAGLATTSKGAKTGLAVVSGLAALYGLVRML